MDGVLLLAHGARDPQWAAPFEAIARHLRVQAPQLRVELAYLELMHPDLPTAVAAMAAAGCGRVSVVPLFLGAGGHVRNDVPRLVEQASRQNPQLRLDCTAAIGQSDAVARALAAAALELVGTLR